MGKKCYPGLGTRKRSKGSRSVAKNVSGCFANVFEKEADVLTLEIE